MLCELQEKQFLEKSLEKKRNVLRERIMERMNIFFSLQTHYHTQRPGTKKLVKIPVRPEMKNKKDAIAHTTGSIGATVCRQLPHFCSIPRFLSTVLPKTFRAKKEV